MALLEALIRDRITKFGAIPVAEYMKIALSHPDHGYYMKGDPFGTAGDFITAPEISQVFGELIGLWTAVTWQQMGRPGRLILIECGPGRGTLMSDLLRAAKSVPGFSDIIEIHLVETSPAMQAHQKAALSGYNPRWHETIATVPDGPAVLIANEFLDALPIRQLVKTNTGWAERCVDIADDGLAFVAGRKLDDARESLPARAAPGTICEICPGAADFAKLLSDRLNASAGAALFIDYGHGRTAAGDTLQAVYRHGFADPLSNPGAADLTAHVDFDAFGRHMRAGGASVNGPISQADFLCALGIRQRTEKLIRGAAPDVANALTSATERLIAPEKMGQLFKVMVATAAEMPRLAGFESWVEEPC